ncbi:hypothetical protein AgCh_018752 [Apium graveolens]
MAHVGQTGADVAHVDLTSGDVAPVGPTCTNVVAGGPAHADVASIGPAGADLGLLVLTWLVECHYSTYGSILLIATVISALLTWDVAGIVKIKWKWDAIIWIYNILSYLLLDPIKFGVWNALSLTPNLADWEENKAWQGTWESCKADRVMKHKSSQIEPRSSRSMLGATEPQPQGTIPLAPQGTNPKLQQLHAPVNSRLIGYEYSTVVTTNPPYGMPLYPEIGGSGHVGRIEARGQTAPYIQGLAPIPEDQEFSGPYTERDSESSDDEVARRRRRAGKEPMVDGNERHRSTRGVKTQEAPRPPLPPRRRIPPPIIDLDGPSQRRAVVPKADPNNLLPLEDLDDPTPPFTEELMNAHISRKFKMPTIKAYDGTEDPANHVRTFSNALFLQPVNDAIKCRAFPQTLSGMAQRCRRVHEKSSASLMSIMLGVKESLRDYLNRFIKEALKVPDLDGEVAMIALQQGTRDEFFKMSLAKRPPESMLQLQDRAGKYIKMEESMRKTVVSNEIAGGKKWKTDLEYIEKEKYPRTEQNPNSTLKKGGPGQKFTEYAKLNAPRSQILMEIEKDQDIRWPKPLKVDPAKLDKSKYCRFHKKVGHDTDECRQLKNEIEFLI